MALPEIPIEKALEYIAAGHRLIYRELPHLEKSIFVITAKPPRGYPSIWRNRRGLAVVDFYDIQSVIGRWLIEGKIKNITPKYLQTEYFEKWYEKTDKVDQSLFVKKRNKEAGR